MTHGLTCQSILGATAVQRTPWRMRFRKRRIQLPSMNLTIFTVIIATAFIERILSIFAVTQKEGCETSRDYLYGWAEGVTGTHDVLLWITGLCLLLIAAHSISSWITERRISPAGFIFGVVNCLLVVLVFRLIGISWAYYNPEEPLAMFIHTQNRPVAEEFGIYLLRDFEEDSQWFDPRAWTCDQTHEDECNYYNVELGLTARKLLISQCMSPELNRLNWAAVTDEPFPANHPSTQVGYVYFDNEERWIRPPQWLQWRNRELVEQLSDAEKEPASLGWWEMNDLLYAQYLRLESAEAALDNRYPTKEEIEKIVVQSWDDQSDR